MSWSAGDEYWQSSWWNEYFPKTSMHEKCASWVIRKYGTSYEAIDGTTGKIEHDGPVAPTVIQAAIDDCTDGQTIFIKSGAYTVDTPLEITDKVINLVGEGSVAGRDEGVSFQSTTLDDDYYIKVATSASNIFGGSVKNIMFYNTGALNAKAQYAILLSNGDLELRDFSIENLRTCYLKRGVVFDGYVSRCFINNVHVDSYNDAFVGDYAVGLLKSNATTDIFFAPKLNNFGYLAHWAQGQWDATVYLNHPRANYNYFEYVVAGAMTSNLAVIYNAGQSNIFNAVHTQDLEIPTAAFEGIITIEKKDATEAPPPGEEAYGGFGNYYRRVAVAYLDAVTFLGGAFRNNVEIVNFNLGTINIDGVAAGIDNHVSISHAAHRYAVDTFTVNVTGTVQVTGYRMDNSGYSTGTGAQQTIAHGCGFTPTASQVYLSERSTGGALAYQSAAPDDTNIYITATNLKDYNWRVTYNP